MRPTRALVVMPGHLSTTPRMLKAADALAAAGYEVRVVSASFLDWAREADARTVATRPWRWDPIEQRRAHAAMRYAVTGMRRHLARRTARVLGIDRASWWAVSRALSRLHDELVDRALSFDFDVVYGGSVGGLAVVEEIARRRGKPFGIDLEDLHTAESTEADADLHHGLARRVLQRILPRAAFVTTSSAAMAASYAAEFHIAPAVVHNVFPLPNATPSFDRRPGPLRLYWFSQTIGPRRGIEEAIAAAEHAGIAAEITLRGRPRHDFVAAVHAAAARMPNVTIRVEEPAAPDRMVALCGGHDVGLAGENQPIENNNVCLPNKVFTYLLAGLPVALSDTRAQRWLAGELGDAAFLYAAQDPRPLGAWFRALADDDGRLQHHRQAAWRAAVARWHWHHAAEEGTLLSLVERAVA